MAIKINGQDISGRIIRRDVRHVMLNGVRIRPEADQLYFSADTPNSTVQLNKYNISADREVKLAISTDSYNWTQYTFGDVITLSNVGDKVYFWNIGAVDGFSYGDPQFYNFAMTGSISAGGSIRSLLKENATYSLSDYCFCKLFKDCTALTIPPRLPAATLKMRCYRQMFDGCTNLIALPSLPASVLKDTCYDEMFYGCTKIKLSETQTGEYQTPYRIPYSSSGTDANNATNNMFTNTGGTFTGTPTINQTYYTSNQVI